MVRIILFATILAWRRDACWKSDWSNLYNAKRLGCKNCHPNDDIIWLTDKNLFKIATLKNSQNDWLHSWLSVTQSIMVKVGVSYFSAANVWYSLINTSSSLWYFSVLNNRLATCRWSSWLTTGLFAKYIIFYRAMHFSAKRGIAIVCCPSVCPWRLGTVIT